MILINSSVDCVIYLAPCNEEWTRKFLCLMRRRLSFLFVFMNLKYDVHYLDSLINVFIHLG